MGNCLKIFILLLFPTFLFAQSEGGFGYRRFSNTTTLNNVSVSNTNTSASRNAYVHSNGLYYVWDGNSWEREHDLDTFSLLNNVIYASLYGDGVPAKTIDLSNNIQCDNVISPASFSTNQNNFNPTGLTGACEIRLTTTAQVNITGIVAQVDGYELILTNEGNHPITLINDATSTAANRFLIGYNYNLGSKQSIRTRYDGTVSRWRVISGLSLGSGSGRIAGGRSQNVLWSYQTDTLNDFGIGYLPTFPSDPTGSGFGSFGLGIDGDLGFQIQGKETYIIGTSFNLLTSSNVNAGADAYQLESRSRATVGGVSNFSYLYGGVTSNQWVLQNTDDLYDQLDIGSKKRLTGVPKNRTDYNYVFQGGGETGSDTSAISMWLGHPQYTDTTNTMGNGTRAVSKERGWGVQSLFNSTIGVRTTNAFDWIKITTGVSPSDTTLDAIRFYGNKYEIPNQTPSSGIGDTSVIVWTSPFNSFFIDIDDFSGGGSGVNIFNSDGTQDDADRLFTQDSTRTFAMGQFTSVSTPTWGRGYYYDPSTSNGIRLLNKNGSNTTTAMVELDPETVNIATTHTTSNTTVSQLNLSESAAWSATLDRTSDTYGSLIIGSATNTNEEIIGLKHNGKADIPGVSVYLGDGYASSQYGLYTSRAWGVQTHVSGGFDWIQVLLPNTATDTTGNNLSFYNRKYYWSNESPSFTNLDTMVHVWIGNGTNATPDFVNVNDLFAGATNIFNSNGTTTDNTRNLTITETLNFIGTASAGVDPYPFQVKVTGTEPYIQLWKGNTDSAYIQQSDVEYIIGSSARFVFQSDDDVVIQADSIQAQTVETKTTIRNLLGLTPLGIIKRFDGDAASSGDVISSNGTDWVITTPTALGYVLQNGNSFGAAMTVGTNDNNVLNFETNNVTRLTITGGASTGGASTFHNINSNTVSVFDVVTIQANTTGTAGTGYGLGILFQGESSTTENRDMAYIRAVWQSATDGTRRSNLSFGTVQSGVFTEGMKLNANFLQPTSGGSLTIGGSSDPVLIGNSTGSASLVSTGTTSSESVLFSAGGNNVNASGTIGNSTFTTTSGTKYDTRFSADYAPTSGTGLFYNARFDAVINQTGGANGATGAIIFEPTLTAIGSKWSAITSATSNSNALFLNQTGSSSYSTHVGAFGFGSTTVPTDKVEVTGNVALLAAGNKLKIATGSNASIGTSGAMTAGTITVNTTAVTANSIILLTGIDGSTPCATCGDLSVGTITAGTSFVINSSINTDTRTVNYLIIN